jgi:hypothetical protein
VKNPFFLPSFHLPGMVGWLVLKPIIPQNLVHRFFLWKIEEDLSVAGVLKMLIKNGCLRGMQVDLITLMIAKVVYILEILFFEIQ